MAHHEATKNIATPHMRQSIMHQSSPPGALEILFQPRGWELQCSPPVTQPREFDSHVALALQFQTTQTWYCLLILQ